MIHNRINYTPIDNTYNQASTHPCSYDKFTHASDNGQREKDVHCIAFSSSVIDPKTKKNYALNEKTTFTLLSTYGTNHSGNLDAKAVDEMTTAEVSVDEISAD